MARAMSRYKQVRITLSEERDMDDLSKRCISVRVLVKPLEADWSHRQVVLYQRLKGQPPLASLDAVYECILETLAGQSLPESPG